MLTMAFIRRLYAGQRAQDIKLFASVVGETQSWFKTAKAPMQVFLVQAIKL